MFGRNLADFDRTFRFRFLVDGNWCGTFSRTKPAYFVQRNRFNSGKISINGRDGKFHDGQRTLRHRRTRGLGGCLNGNENRRADVIDNGWLFATRRQRLLFPDISTSNSLKTKRIHALISGRPNTKTDDRPFRRSKGKFLNRLKIMRPRRVHRPNRRISLF